MQLPIQFENISTLWVQMCIRLLFFLAHTQKQNCRWI